MTSEENEYENQCKDVGHGHQVKNGIIQPSSRCERIITELA